LKVFDSNLAAVTSYELTAWLSVVKPGEPVFVILIAEVEVFHSSRRGCGSRSGDDIKHDVRFGIMRRPDTRNNIELDFAIHIPILILVWVLHVSRSEFG
jgi:hypothetical protein